MKSVIIALLFLAPVFAQNNIENLKMKEKSNFSHSTIFAKIDKNALTLKEKSGFTATKLNADVKKGLTANKINIENLANEKTQNLTNASKKGFSGKPKIATLDAGKSKSLKTGSKAKLTKEKFQIGDSPGLLKK
jgi:hypothetical protein